jgi:hypothetical protein
LGSNSDLMLDLYYEQPDGSLLQVGDTADSGGIGSNVTETLTLNLKAEPVGGEPGTYYVRVSSYDTNLFGPGSDYDLQVSDTAGGSGGAVLIGNEGLPFNYGYYYVSLSLDDALAAGAAWRIAEFENNETWHSNNTQKFKTQVPAANHWHIVFQALPGFSAPPEQELLLKVGKTITVPANYAYTNPYTNLVPRIVSMSLGTNADFQFTCLGRSGRYYAIEESTNLLHWVPLTTNQIHQDGMLRFSRTNAPPQTRAFYRWHLIE